MEWKPVSGTGDGVEVAQGGQSPRRSLVWPVLFGCSGVRVLSMVLLAGATYWAARIYADAPVAVLEDREGVINMYDVLAWNPGSELDWDDSIEVDPWLLGSREWVYEYDAPLGGMLEPWVHSVRTDDPTLADAQTSFGLQILTLGARVKGLGEGFELETFDAGGPAGESRYLARIVAPWGVVGNVLAVRKNLTTFGAIYGPASFTTGTEIDRHVAPVLDRALAFIPSTDR